MTKKKEFTWYDTNGNVFYDGAMVAALVKNVCNPNAKAGIQVIRNNITHTTAAAFQNDVPRNLEHIQKIWI